MPRRLAQEVARHCLLRIVNEDYQPGSVLPTENDLADSFGVSRVVVHEALQILSSKSVLDVRQGRQAIVTPQGQWDPLDTEILLCLFEAGKLGPLARDMVQVRKILEVEAAGAAAEKATDEEVTTLEHLLAQMLAHHEQQAEYYDLEDRFHRCIWQACRNVLLIQMLMTMNHIFRFAKMMAGRRARPERDFHHVTLLKAIAAHDVPAARDAMLHDIGSFDDELRVALENGFKNENPPPSSWS